MPRSGACSGMFTANTVRLLRANHMLTSCELNANDT